MRILITKASDDDFQEIRENQNAQDIINLIQEFNHRIIIKQGGMYTDSQPKETGFRRKDVNFDYTITIYDDYIE